MRVHARQRTELTIVEHATPYPSIKDEVLPRSLALNVSILCRKGDVGMVVAEQVHSDNFVRIANPDR